MIASIPGGILSVGITYAAPAWLHLSSPVSEAGSISGGFSGATGYRAAQGLFARRQRAALAGGPLALAVREALQKRVKQLLFEQDVRFHLYPDVARGLAVTIPLLADRPDRPAVDMRG